MNLATKLGFACVLALGLVVLGWYLGASSVEDGAEGALVVQPSPTGGEQENSRLAAEVAALQLEFQAADARLVEQQQGLDAVREAMASYEDLAHLAAELPARPGALSAEDARELKQKIEDYADAINQRLGDGPGYDIHRPLFDAYEAETVDPDWAYEREQELYEAFATDRVLQGFHLKSVECRSTRCRVQLQYQYQDMDDASLVAGRLNRHIMEQQGELLSPSMFFRHLGDEDMMEIYLADDPDLLLLH